MTLKAFSILDTKANIFNGPFLLRTTGEAIRAFHDLCNDPQSTINKHPDDYRMFYVGTFDQELGIFNELAKPELVSTAADLIKPSPQQTLAFPKAVES